MRPIKLFIFAIFLTAFWSCSDLGEPCEGDCGDTNDISTSYSVKIQPIFTSNCNVCHIGGTSGGLDLSEGSSYNNLVNVTSQNYSPSLRVNPNSATTSVLWNKVSSSDNGNQMPQGGPYLSQSDVDLIKTWINEGAQDN